MRDARALEYWIEVEFRGRYLASLASAVRGDGPAPFHLLLEIRMGSLSHHRRVTINAHSNLPCFSIPCKSGSERESDETATFTQLSSPAELRGTDVGHRHPLGHG